jgi:two-component system, LytTR family, response regulator
MEAKTISAVVIDDEADARELMARIISGFDELKLLATANNAFEGLQIIAKHRPDIAFLDINMPVQSGLELGELISQSSLPTRIVFVTAYDAYVMQAIRSAAFDYLLKPVDPDELKKVIERYKATNEQIYGKAVSQVNDDHGTKIRLNVRTGYILVDPEEIVVVKADGNYVEIILRNDEKLLVSQPLGYLAEILPAKVFVRVSRSSIINMKYLRQVDKKCRKAILKAGELQFQATISREYMATLDLKTK